jgi:hypothetical protein
LLFVVLRDWWLGCFLGCCLFRFGMFPNLGHQLSLLACLNFFIKFVYLFFELFVIAAVRQLCTLLLSAALPTWEAKVPVF